MTDTRQTAHNRQPKRRVDPPSRLVTGQPEDLLFQLRRAVIVYRQQVLPQLAHERQRVLRILTDADEGAVSDYARIVAEELSTLVDQIEDIQPDLLQNPSSTSTRGHAIGLLCAAAELATVATRFERERVLSPVRDRTRPPILPSTETIDPVRALARERAE